MIHWLSTAFSTYIVHPLRGAGYQWWSGAGSDLAYATVIVGMWHRHNCHKDGCWRVVRHGHTHCKKHKDQACN